EKYYNISIDEKKPEFIFIFANRDPDSAIAKRELNAAIEEYGSEAVKDFFVATSSDMGYVMFRYSQKGTVDRYIPIEDYVKL
nr:hypothetical protein [Lachnospiraceae bacterium]